MNPKNEDSLRSFWDNTSVPIFIPWGYWKEKRKSKKLKTIMMENFPNLVKKTDIQVQEVQSPKQDEPKETYTKTHHN